MGRASGIIVRTSWGAPIGGHRGRAALPHPTDEPRQEREQDHDSDDDINMLVDARDVAAQEVSDEEHAPYPAQSAQHIVRNEVPVAHVGNTRHHWSERPDDGHEPCEHDRLAAMLLIELMGTVEVLLLKNNEFSRVKMCGPAACPIA